MLKAKHQQIRDKYGLEGGRAIITPVEEKSATPRAVEKEGILLKRGKMNTAFKKRWFQLLHGQLSYHKHSFEPPCGVIPVSQLQRVQLLVQQQPPELHLEIPGRVFVIRSPSNAASELRDWGTAIRDAQQTQ